MRAFFIWRPVLEIKMGNPLDDMFRRRGEVSGYEIGGDTPQARQGQGSMRRLFAAGTATTVAAAGSAEIQAIVSQAFKAERMYINAAMATAAMTISNIRIATFSLNVTPNALAIDMFLRDAVGTELSGYTAQPGVGLVISVNNPSGAGVLCNPSFMGWSHVEG